MLPISFENWMIRYWKNPVAGKMKKTFRRRATWFALKNDTFDLRLCQDHDDAGETLDNDGLAEHEEDQD